MSYKEMISMGYQGPNGPHLNCTTRMTTTGQRKDNGTSIHPNGKGKRKGNDGPICAPRNPERKGYLAKASKALDIRRREFAAMSATKQVGYNVPGSMQL